MERTPFCLGYSQESDAGRGVEWGFREHEHELSRFKENRASGLSGPKV